MNMPLSELVEGIFIKKYNVWFPLILKLYLEEIGIVLLLSFISIISSTYEGSIKDISSLSDFEKYVALKE